MLDQQTLQSLSEGHIKVLQLQTKQLLHKISKSELTSVKSMIMPPLFTYNVLKIVMILHDPDFYLDQANFSQITWNTIRKDLLKRHDIFTRKCENINMGNFDIDITERLEQIFEETFKAFGEKLFSKAELYGNLVSTLCMWSINMRALMHAYKNTRSQD